MNTDKATIELLARDLALVARLTAHSLRNQEFPQAADQAMKVAHFWEVMVDSDEDLQEITL